MIEITVIGSDLLNAAFLAVRNRTSDLRPFWGSIASVFSDREEFLFTSGGDGNWPPLTPNYAAWKARVRPGPILSFDGDLKESLTPKITKGIGNRPNVNAFTIYNEDANKLEIGTSHPYAVFHNEGVGKAKLRRPPIIVDEDTKATMLEVLREDFEIYTKELGFTSS